MRNRAGGSGGRTPAKGSQSRTSQQSVGGRGRVRCRRRSAAGRGSRPGGAAWPGGLYKRRGARAAFSPASIVFVSKRACGRRDGPSHLVKHLDWDPRAGASPGHGRTRPLRCCYWSPALAVLMRARRGAPHANGMDPSSPPPGRQPSVRQSASAWSAISRRPARLRPLRDRPSRAPRDVPARGRPCLTA